MQLTGVYLRGPKAKWLVGGRKRYPGERFPCYAAEHVDERPGQKDGHRDRDLQQLDNELDQEIPGGGEGRLALLPAEGVGGLLLGE